MRGEIVLGFQLMFEFFPGAVESAHEGVFIFSRQLKRGVEIAFVDLLLPMRIFLLRLPVIFLLIAVVPKLLLPFLCGYAIGVGQGDVSGSGEGVKKHGELNQTFYPFGVLLRLWVERTRAE